MHVMLSWVQIKAGCAVPAACSGLQTKALRDVQTELPAAAMLCGRARLVLAMHAGLKLS